MAPKRPHDDDSARPDKKQRKGFQVGPANLPEGIHKQKGETATDMAYNELLRRPACGGVAPLFRATSYCPFLVPPMILTCVVQKIKKDLIHKAKLKKEYAKIKAREEPTASRKSVYEREAEKEDKEEDEAPTMPVQEPTLEPHPDRLRLLERTSPDPEPTASEPYPIRRQRRPRPQPYKNETELARKRKEDAEARQNAREEAEKERQKRLAERERFRKTMAKARGGPDGKRKLGRESTVLLEKVKRMVGNP